MPRNTPVGLPAATAAASPASSSASQATSQQQPLLRIDADRLARRDAGRTAASNSSTRSMKPPRRVYIWPGTARRRVVEARRRPSGRPGPRGWRRAPLDQAAPQRGRRRWHRPDSGRRGRSRRSAREPACSSVSTRARSFFSASAACCSGESGLSAIVGHGEREFPFDQGRHLRFAHRLHRQDVAIRHRLGRP